MVDWDEIFAGSLLGTAVGDAIGLPREGLSARRARRMFGAAPLEHRLIRGRGMMSDDTEHACMTAQALLQSKGETDLFARSLAWRLRGWLLGAPAGIGFATLRSILKLWCGVSPQRSGVESAGNGPAMRAPILGVWSAARNLSAKDMRSLVAASTLITHTDPRAIEGAMAVALVARQAAGGGGAALQCPELMERVLAHISGDELRAHLGMIPRHVASGASAAKFARAIGLDERGVSGYINHTVPVVLFCCMRWPEDLRACVEGVVALGGDTDTTGAIVGGIMGGALGRAAIPDGWGTGLLEWPRNSGWLRDLGARLAAAAGGGGGGGPLPLFWPGLPLRNATFAAIVLMHGFRRLCPPY